MQLSSELIHKKVPSFLSLVKFMFGFIQSVLKFGDFLDTDVLHFLIILFERLEVFLLCSHFGLVVLLEILTSLDD
jgi:hypothetical protein